MCEKWKCLQVRPRKMAESNVSPDDFLTKMESGPVILITQQDPGSSPIKNELVDKLEIDLSIKCRGCFAEDPEMHYLFTIFDQQLSLADILAQTTSIVCKEDDGFPPYLCTRCTTCLIDFFNFKVQLQKTDLYVKTLLGTDLSSAVPYDENDVLPEDNQEYSDTEKDEAKYEVEDFSNQSSEKKDFFMPTIAGLTDVSPKQCELCNQYYQDGNEYETHAAKEHGKNPFQKFSKFRKLIIQHEKEQADARKRKRCLKTISNFKQLMDAPGKVCRLCRQVFTTEDEFKLHWETHKVYNCDECTYKCIKKSDLDIHRMCVHNSERNFTCSVCDKAFKTKQMLQRHLKLHLNPRMYCCDICGQRFNDNGTLKTHIHLKHIRSRDFICPICGLAYPMKATLDKHIMRHNKDRPPSFFCDTCESAFKDKWSLKRHNLVKHSKEFVRPSCSGCGKTYCSTTKLRRHIERHHSDKPFERKKRTSKRHTETVVKYESSESESAESDDSFCEIDGNEPQMREFGDGFLNSESKVKVKSCLETLLTST